MGKRICKREKIVVDHAVVWEERETGSSRANSEATLHPVQYGVRCQTSVSRVRLLVHLHIAIIAPTFSDAILFLTKLTHVLFYDMLVIDAFSFPDETYLIRLFAFLRIETGSSVN